uniref:Uncharacterized protein n=1 Tax=Rhizophora mucronata TaxID=61149 RepID=A0A2P2LM09_RHIMU
MIKLDYVYYCYIQLILPPHYQEIFDRLYLDQESNGGICHVAFLAFAYPPEGSQCLHQDTWEAAFENLGDIDLVIQDGKANSHLSPVISPEQNP